MCAFRTYVPVRAYELSVRINYTYVHARYVRARTGVIVVLRWCSASGAVVVASFFSLRTATRPVVAPFWWDFGGGAFIRSIPVSLGMYRERLRAGLRRRGARGGGMGGGLEQLRRPRAS